jgi:predicted AAA+ superfamily ATPase
MKYLKRAITNKIISRSMRRDVIVVTGARQTGKTTLCETIIPEALHSPFAYFSFDDPDERIRFKHSAISILETVKEPLIILDEVQKLPELFDPLKYVVDRQAHAHTREKKVFILTGSSQLLLLKNIKETLAGRVGIFNLYPFSFSELSEQTDAPSLLSEIFTKKRITKEQIERVKLIPSEKVRALIRIRDEHHVWGGYPPVWQIEEKAGKIDWLKDYRKTYLERDILDVGKIANLDTFILSQKLLCARTGQLLSISEVAKELTIAVNTVKRFIYLLTATFQCYLLLPYFENVGKRFIKSPKIYFPDAGLNRVIVGDTGISPGASYETWVFSELIKWKQLQDIEPDIFFYRTSGGLEIDFLIKGEGIILPIEAKASEKVSSSDGHNLERFLNEHKSQSPFGIIVYRGKEMGEVRKNIWAIPDWFLFG